MRNKSCTLKMLKIHWNWKKLMKKILNEINKNKIKKNIKNINIKI